MSLDEKKTAAGSTDSQSLTDAIRRTFGPIHEHLEIIAAVWTLFVLGVAVAYALKIREAEFTIITAVVVACTVGATLLTKVFSRLQVFTKDVGYIPEGSQAEARAVRYEIGTSSRTEFSIAPEGAVRHFGKEGAPVLSPLQEKNTMRKTKAPTTTNQEPVSIPPGTYTKDTLPPLSPAARNIVERVQRAARMRGPTKTDVVVEYSDKHHVGGEFESGKLGLRLSEIGKVGLRLTDK